MANVEVQISQEGMRELMKSAWAQGLLKAEAEKIAAKACGMASDDSMDNPPFDAHVFVGAVSAKANVSTASDHGEYANAKNNILLKASE